MATKLYFRFATNSIGGLPSSEQSSLSSDLDAQSQSINRTLSETKGSSQQTQNIDTIATTGTREYYFNRFVSAALDMASISTNTWTYAFVAGQDDNLINFPVSGSNQPVRVNCYVWRPSTSSKVGTILDGNTSSTVDEGGSGSKVSHVVNFSGSSVSSMQTGDVLIFEVWFIISRTSGHSGIDPDVYFYYDGTTDPTENSTNQNAASYISTPQTLVYDLGLEPVSQTSIQKYRIAENVTGTSIHKYDIFDASIVQTTSKHKYNILSTSEGFSLFTRLYIPYLKNEFLYGKRGVLFSKIDDEQVTFGYAAQVSDTGDIYFFVRHDSREYTLVAHDALAYIADLPTPDFNTEDFNSQDFLTATSILNLIPKPIPYDDLAFTYEFVNHRMQIVKNGEILADSDNTPVSNSLVGRWVLNEGTGTIARNRVRGKPDGVIDDATWNVVEGRTYLEFDDTGSDSVLIPNYNEIQRLKEFTVSLWYYPYSVSSGDNYFLISKNWSNNESFILYTASNGNLQLVIKNSSGTVVTVTKTTPFPTLNQWYNIVARWRGDGTPPEIFIDDTVTSGGSTLSATEINTGTTQLIIGGSAAPDGLIRDVSFYNRAITDEEITTLFEGQDNYPLRQNLVAEFKLNEGGDIGDDLEDPQNFDRIAYNGVETGNNGTITNAEWSNELGEHETYLDFLSSGSNRSITIPNYSAIEDFTELSISLWYYPRSESISANYLFVSKNWSNNGSFVFYTASNGSLRLSTKNSSGTIVSVVVNSPFPTLNKWYHIVAKYSDGGPTVMYVDGVKTSGSSQTGAIETGSTDLIIGNTGTSVPDGYLHDVKIWNLGLTDKEVEELYNDGHSVSGFPKWEANPPPPPEIPVPITNPFEQVYHLAKPASNWEWQTLHKLVASGFTEAYTNQDGVTIPEDTVPFSTVYENTVSGGGGGGGSTETIYDVSQSSSSHIELNSDDNFKAGAQINGGSHIGKVVTQVVARGRKYGSPSGTCYCKIWSSGGSPRVTIGETSVSNFPTTFTKSDNTYQLQSGDVVGIEYSGGSEDDGIELDQNDSNPNSDWSAKTATNGSFGTDDVSSSTDAGLQIIAGGGGETGSGFKLFDPANGGSTPSGTFPPDWNSLPNRTIAQRITSTSTSQMDGNKITKVTVTVSKVGSGAGTIAIISRDSVTSNAFVIENISSGEVGASPTVITKTNLNNTHTLGSGDSIVLNVTGGNSSNYYIVSGSTGNGSPNSSGSTLSANTFNTSGGGWPSHNGWTWNDQNSDMVAKFEAGGTTAPEKPHWFSLDGTIRGVGEKLINSNSVLAGDKITRVAPKLRSVGNPVGTIKINIRNSSNTIVDTCGTIEADTVSPGSFTEYLFTDLLQNRTLASGDKVMIDYTGTPTNYIDVMVEHDESHGGQLGNEQLQTWNGSSFTDVTADLCGKMYVGGTPTDVTARVRAGAKAETDSSILKLTKPSRINVWMRRVGSPPNQVTCRIRRGSDDNTRAVIGEKDAIDITNDSGGEQIEFTNSPVSIYAMQENDSILIEYDDGDDNNYVEIAIATTEQIDTTHTYLVLYDALWTDYDLLVGEDLIATIEQGGDTYTPVGDEIPDPPPPVYTHDLHIFAGGYPWSYYEENDSSTIENWIGVISTDIRFYRKILTAEELTNIYINRRDRSNVNKGQIAIVGFFSLPPFS